MTKKALRLALVTLAVSGVQWDGWGLVSLSLQAQTTRAQDTGETREGIPNQKSASAKSSHDLTPRSKNSDNQGEYSIDLDRKQAVLSFVETHQPQVKRLLNSLEKNRPLQYRRAMVALSREVERLQELQSKDSGRFETALAIWKNQKSIEFVSAQIALKGETEDLRSSLKQLVVDRRKLLLAGVEAEMNSLQNRLSRLERQKSELANEEEVEKRVEQLIAQARKMKNDRQKQQSK